MKSLNKYIVEANTVTAGKVENNDLYNCIRQLERAGCIVWRDFDYVEDKEKSTAVIFIHTYKWDYESMKSMRNSSNAVTIANRCKQFKIPYYQLVSNGNKYNYVGPDNKVVARGQTIKNTTDNTTTLDYDAIQSMTWDTFASTYKLT
jgi:hypothetical protein